MPYPGAFQPRDYYVCFWLDPHLYVPHHELPLWIGPDHSRTGRAFTARELDALGARRTVRLLWSRPFHEPITHIDILEEHGNGP